MGQELLDLDKAIQRIGGDEEFLKELLTELVAQIDINLENLKQVAQENDFTNLKTMAHSLKGVSANLNVNLLAAHFFELEKLANDKKSAAALDLLQKIRIAKEDLEQFIKDLDYSG